MNTNQHNRSLSQRRAAVRHICRRSGTSVMEMAISMSVLLFLTFGMVEFGQFMYIRHAFAAAARDGARVAILQSTQADVTPVNNAIQKELAWAGITYTASSGWLTFSTTQDTTGNPASYYPVTDPSQVSSGWPICVTLTTTYSQLPMAFRPLSGITGNKWGIGATKQITGTTMMIRE